MIQIVALGILISTAAATLIHPQLHAPYRMPRSSPGTGLRNYPTQHFVYPALTHPTHFYSSYAGHHSVQVPVKFEVRPEDVSGGVSGFLHQSVSPNTAWFWVQGQKWKWNHIHSALHAAGLQGLSQYAPYPPTWGSGFPPRPAATGPLVQVVPIAAPVPGIGQFITGPSYVIHKKKK